MPQHPIEPANVESQECVEAAFAPAKQFSVLLIRRILAQQGRAHHRRQRQRNDAGNDDGERQRDGKFAEQPADHAAHQQQRNEDRDQRDGQRDDGEADLSGALQRRRQRRFAGLDIAHDVLDHDDGVVDDETGGDGQRHQREIVQAEAAQRHAAEGGDQRDRQRDAWDHGRPELAQEDEDHHHDQSNRQHQRELNVVDGGADRDGAVGDHRDLERRRQRGLQLGQHRLDGLDHVDRVGAWLALDIEQHRRRSLEPGRLFGILDAVDRIADVAQQHRRAVAIGDHRVLIGIGVKQLVVGVDLERLSRTVQRSLGIVGGGGGDAAANIIERHAEPGEAGRDRPAGERPWSGRPRPRPRRRPEICDSFGTMTVTA